MVVYEEIYLEGYINNQCIWLKNNITQLYFILGRAELHWNFSSLRGYGVVKSVVKSVNIRAILKSTGESPMEVSSPDIKVICIGFFMYSSKYILS